MVGYLGNRVGLGHRLDPWQKGHIFKAEKLIQWIVPRVLWSVASQVVCLKQLSMEQLSDMAAQAPWSGQDQPGQSDGCGPVALGPEAVDDGVHDGADDLGPVLWIRFSRSLQTRLEYGKIQPLKYGFMALKDLLIQVCT
jgi:hypothetical protein